MNEDTSTQENQTPESPPEEAPQTTLEDVAKKWNVQEEVKQLKVEPKAQQAPAPQYAEPYIDPEEAYKRQIQDMGGVLRELNDQVSEIRRTAEQERLNRDVNQAVAKVNEKLKVEPLLAEILLEKRYRDDPNFKRIWDNRNVAPKALDEALGIIASESQKIFNVRTDPQLVENQRAAKASQRAQASASESSEDDEWGKLSDGEFDRKWREYMHGGF